MRLAIGVVRDSQAVGDLAGLLLCDGCLADHFLVVTDAGSQDDLVESDICTLISTLCVWGDQPVLLWYVREPKYFSGGIRDQRKLVRDALTILDVVKEKGSVSQQQARSRASARHMPIVIVQLNKDRQHARSELRVLMKLAQAQVEIVDIPVRPLIGSFYFENAS